VENVLPTFKLKLILIHTLVKHSYYNYQILDYVMHKKTFATVYIKGVNFEGNSVSWFELQTISISKENPYWKM